MSQGHHLMPYGGLSDNESDLSFGLETESGELDSSRHSPGVYDSYRSRQSPAVYDSYRRGVSTRFEFDYCFIKTK